MIRSKARINSAFLLTILLIVAAALPFAVQAQESSADVRAAIRSELANDPRTSGFSEAQIDAMVDILLAEAQKDGLTASDITWQPAEAETFDTQDASSSGGVATSCDAYGILCAFSDAFGFVGVGPHTITPFILGASSMALIWIIAEMLHRHRMRMPVPASTPASM